MMHTQLTIQNTAIKNSPILDLNAEKIALFLDIDGTLIDIAETPDQVIVPDDLGDMLNALYYKLDGALALITGRSIKDADHLIGKRLPIAGLHGADIRDANGRFHHFPQSLRFTHAKDFLLDRAKHWPDLLVEDKGAAIALHFRQKPDLHPIAGDLILKALRIAGPNYAAQRGKMVVELKLAAPDKGKALRFFMGHANYSRRMPICFGDDLTDESMFATVNQLGGLPICIGRPMHMTAAQHSIPSPQNLREWLEGLLR